MTDQVPPPQQGYAQPPQGYAQPPQGYGQPPQGYGAPPPPAPPGAPQTKQVEWMPPPQGIANCPPGLEYLTQIDQVLVHQQVELWELMTGWETANRYVVKNTLGQQIYFAAETAIAVLGSTAARAVRSKCQLWTTHRGKLSTLCVRTGAIAGAASAACS